MSAVARVLDVAMAGLFVWAAQLQLNDPDPARWVGIYAAGAVVAALSVLSSRSSRSNSSNRSHSVASPGLRSWLGRGAALLAGLCLVWAGVLADSLLGVELPGLADLGAPMTPDQPQVEWARELLGLLIVAGWSAGVARRTRD